MKTYSISREGLPKTVELIIERTAWTPPVPHYTVETLAPLHIATWEASMRSQAKAAGGMWNAEKWLWFVKFAKIAVRRLKKHI